MVSVKLEHSAFPDDIANAPPHRASDLQLAIIHTGSGALASSLDGIK